MCFVCPYTDEAQVFSWGRADYGQLGVADNMAQQSFCSEPTEIKHVRGSKQVHDGLVENNHKRDYFIYNKTTRPCFLWQKSQWEPSLEDIKGLQSKA